MRDLLSPEQRVEFVHQTDEVSDLNPLRNPILLLDQAKAGEPRPIMFENRIATFFSTPELTPAVAAPAPAFVACPAPLFASFTAAQQSFVAEVYRRAQELTEALFRKPARRAIPEFSRN